MHQSSTDVANCFQFVFNLPAELNENEGLDDSQQRLNQVMASLYFKFVIGGCFNYHKIFVEPLGEFYYFCYNYKRQLVSAQISYICYKAKIDTTDERNLCSKVVVFLFFYTFSKNIWTFSIFSLFLLLDKDLEKHNKINHV